MSLFPFATVVPSRLALALSTALVSPCLFAQAAHRLNTRVSCPVLPTLLSFDTNTRQTLPTRHEADLINAASGFRAFAGTVASGHSVRCEVFA